MSHIGNILILASKDNKRYDMTQITFKIDFHKRNFENSILYLSPIYILTEGKDYIYEEKNYECFSCFF